MPKGSHIGGYDPLALAYVLIVFAAALLVPALIARFARRPSDSDGDGGDGAVAADRGAHHPSRRTTGTPSAACRSSSQGRRESAARRPSLGQRLPARPRRQVREPARPPAPGRAHQSRS